MVNVSFFHLSIMTSLKDPAYPIMLRCFSTGGARSHDITTIMFSELWTPADTDIDSLKLIQMEI